MSKLTDKLIELAVITAEQAEDEAAVCAAIEQLQSDNLALSESNAALVKENNDFKLAAERAQSAAADTVIQAAIAEGKFSANNKQVIDHFRKQLASDFEGTKTVLAALHAYPILQRQVTVKAGDTRRMSAEASSRTQLQKLQTLAVAEVRRANPKLSHVEAFNIAKRDKREFFPDESDVET